MLRKAIDAILFCLAVLITLNVYAADTCGAGMEPVRVSLPSSYTGLEYIESTGTQYIDTGIKATFDLSIHFTTFLTQPIESGHTLFGYNGVGTTEVLLGFNGMSRYYLLGSSGNLTPALKTNQIYDIDVIFQSGNSKYIINGIEVASSASTKITNARHIILCGAFSKYPVSNVTANPGQRIMQARIEQGGELIQNLIPAKRNSDGVIGMYDTVTGTFFENSGTGDFVAGTTCRTCQTGYYNNVGNDTACIACPDGYVANGGAASEHDEISDCKIECVGGYYPENGQCVGVGNGYWSTRHIYGYGDIDIRNQCPVGLTTIGFGGGADEAGDCGRKLHIGDEVLYLRSDKKTTPSLNVRIGDDMFYGHAATTRLNMNVNSQRYLHAGEYYIHDDSILPNTDGYIYDSNGRLIGASDKIYLESTGTQYINTEYLLAPTLDENIFVDVAFFASRQCYFWCVSKWCIKLFRSV